MVLHDIELVSQNDLSKFMWNGLRRYHHVPVVSDIIMKRHSVPEKHRSNVEKQANQIRHCLIQAREYRDAAAVVSLSTKPLLLYYSLMSLALAQILLKSDGNSSLDRARGEHAHHGLVFSPGSTMKGNFSFSHVASQIQAKPMISSEGQRRGTFELWHRISREDPIGGYVVRRQHDGTRTGCHGLMSGDNVRFGTLLPKGISLLDCFQALPGMLEILEADGIKSNVVRGRVSVEISPDELHRFNLIIHPARSALVNKIIENIKVSAKDFESISVVEIEGGLSIYIIQRDDNRANFLIPPCTTWSSDEIRFLPPDTVLNEFGHIYVGLYMLGNYARYFPDRWVSDVETGSPLAHASEVFLDMAEKRMALLTYSDFLGRYCVPRA